MKSFILLIIIALPLIGFGQEKTEKQKQKRRKEQISRISTDVGLISGVVNSSFSRHTSEGFNLNYSKSKSFSISYIFNSAENRDQVLSYSIGAGFETSQFHLKTNSNLYHTDTTTYLISEPSIKYSKNALTVAYIKFPLMLKINKEIKDNYYQCSFGIIPGLKLFNSYKQKYLVESDSYKVKRDGDFNLNPFKLETTLRFGRKNIGVFVNYDLLPLFEKTVHEQLYPFSVGLTYQGF